MLILDEVLALVTAGIISCEEIRSLIELKDAKMDLILTGAYKGEALWDVADEITVMQMVKCYCSCQPQTPAANGVNSNGKMCRT